MGAAAGAGGCVWKIDDNKAAAISNRDIISPQTLAATRINW
ncbi:MAG TPA: hypothetical protein VFW39_11450 [Sphingomicrobium sp.]|nr:hypothetical protein [Sphingomicrobium sp.]